MKKSLLILIVLLTGIAWWLSSPKHTSHESPEPHETHSPEIFQKVFWHQPTPEDHILHALKQPLPSQNGIPSWCWYITIKPSPDLLRHLLTENAFGLLAQSAPIPEAAPAWFPKSIEGHEIHRSPDSTFILLFNRQSNLLHAAKTAAEFRPPVREDK